MGVAGLWDVLKPAGMVRSLTDLAIKEGFLANPDKKRGFRLGIDASIWFFHAEYGREGENPVLRTLFFRCATLMHTTFLPLFVFDGPKRPDFKRGKKINRTNNALIPGMKAIVEAFGFEWRMAPGEAEAELAYLNRIGIIDGVLSDDVDNFLFGARTVIRNSSNTLSGNRANPILNSSGKDDKNHSRIFRIEDITNHRDIRLTQGGMILVGLMSGGDYHQGGLMRCGVKTAVALARCGFGDSLCEAATSLDRESLEDFLVMWRQEIRDELRTNSKGEIGSKQVSLSKSIPEAFPNIDILLSYVKPITSQSMGRESNNLKITWAKEPDVAKLAGVCEMYFEWGYKEAIIKRFRTVMWHSITLRILRRAVLELDEGHAPRGLDTPKKSRKGKEREDDAPCGTPSKMIAKHFASMELSPTKVYLSGSESEEEDEQRLIVKIHSTREHASTDGLLEYRLEIAPKQLVELAESGIEGRRAPEGPDEWASEDDEDEDGGKKKGKKDPVDPESHLRLWMPACMVKLVEPKLVQAYEDIQEQKKLKKAKKGTRTAKSQTSDKPAAKRKPTTKKSAAPPPDDGDESDLFLSTTRPETPPPPPRKKPAAKAKGARLPAAPSDEDSEDELPQYVAPRPALAKENSPRSKASGSKLVLTDDEPDEYDLRQLMKIKTSATLAISVSKKGRTLTESSNQASNSIRSRTGVRDLTKPKQDTFSSARSDMKSFFSVTKPSTTELGKPSQSDLLRPTLASRESSASTSTSQSSASSSVLSSPSKRKIREKPRLSSSESENTGHLHKSPRKKVAQTSPKARLRPTSPSPTKAVTKKLAVIEISSESDDDDLPASIIPASSLPPLLRAQARKAATSTVMPSSSKSIMKSSNIKKVTPVSTLDVIDLT